MPTRPVVLCVDPDPEILAAVARLFRYDGHEVITAATASEALAVLAARPIDVLVSDFELPEMGGGELARRLREMQPAAVGILLTGRRPVEAVPGGADLGEGLRFAALPFDPDTLRRQVSAAVRDVLPTAAVARLAGR